MRGTVKWFNATKRFGFIQRDDGQPDLFMHASDLEGTQAVREGASVEFEIGEDNRGRPKAIRIQLLQ